MFSKVNDESVWFGPDQEKKSDWIYNLDNDDIQEIEKVTDKFLLSKIPLKNIKNEYFNLENLEKIKKEQGIDNLYSNYKDRETLDQIIKNPEKIIKLK